MKPVRAIFALALGTVALAGCSPSPEDAFIQSIKDDTPQVFDRGSETEAIELGRALCTNMDDGSSAHDAAGMLEGLGWSIAEAGTVVIAAVDNFCPEHEDLVR
ncbi:DUF732 domain-containing protein [Microbacterium faecale]|nr:DUF732 domain-containing protein [Microbacterium faecale]